MNLGQLTTLVRQYVDDPQGGYFTKTTTNTFLNNAQREVQKQLIQAGEMYYLKPVQTTTVKNQPDYALPSDFLKVNRIEIILSGVAPTEAKRFLAVMTLNQQDLVTEAVGTPSFYVIKKDRFTVYPTPDTGYIMRLFYSHRVTDMINDSDIPDCPEEFHECLAIFAAYDCFIKDDRNPSSLLEKREFYLKMFKQMAEARDESRPRYVVVTQPDDYGYLF